jgi:hypothetical protein
MELLNVSTIGGFSPINIIDAVISNSSITASTLNSVYTNSRKINNLYANQITTYSSGIIYQPGFSPAKYYSTSRDTMLYSTVFADPTVLPGDPFPSALYSNIFTTQSVNFVASTGTIAFGNDSFVNYFPKTFDTVVQFTHSVLAFNEGYIINLNGYTLSVPGPSWVGSNVEVRDPALNLLYTSSSASLNTTSTIGFVRSLDGIMFYTFEDNATANVIYSNSSVSYANLSTIIQVNAFYRIPFTYLYSWQEFEYPGIQAIQNLTTSSMNVNTISSAFIGTTTINVNTISSAVIGTSTINVNTISSLLVSASSITTSSILGLTPRSATTPNILYYNTGTKELTYGAVPNGTGTIVSSFNSFSTGTASIGALNVSSIGGFSPIQVRDALIANSTISASTIVGSVGNISSLNVGAVNVLALNDRVKASQGDQVRAISTWRSQNSINTAYFWRAIAWSPKLRLFAAVRSIDTGAGTNYIMTSPDGVNWTSRTHLAGSINAITWSEKQGKFVAIGDDGLGVGVGANGYSWVSTDGITWTRYATGGLYYWNQYLTVCYSPELDRYVAGAWLIPNFAFYGTTIIYSSDGQTWTQGSNPFQVFSITWSKQLGIFVGVGNNNAIYTSPDGISWTAQTYANSQNWHCVTWSPELQLFIAVSRDTSTSTHIIRSSDGVNWTASTTPDTSAGWTTVVWSPELSLFVMVASEGTYRWYNIHRSNCTDSA